MSSNRHLGDSAGNANIGPMDTATLELNKANASKILDALLGPEAASLGSTRIRDRNYATLSAPVELQLMSGQAGQSAEEFSGAIAIAMNAIIRTLGGHNEMSAEGIRLCPHETHNAAQTQLYLYLRGEDVQAAQTKLRRHEKDIRNLISKTNTEPSRSKLFAVSRGDAFTAGR
jgi:hypothetical protein